MAVLAAIAIPEYHLNDTS
jgi:hypothetical protein